MIRICAPPSARSVLLLCFQNSGTSFEPFDGKFLLGICEFGTGFARARILSLPVVRLPRDRGQSFDLRLCGLERGITKLGSISPLEFLALQLRQNLTRANGWPALFIAISRFPTVTDRKSCGRHTNVSQRP